MHHPVILSEAAPRILRAAESKDLRLLLHLPSSSPNPHPVILSEAAPRILRAAESKDLRLLLHLFLALQLFLWTHSPLPKHLHWHSPLLTQIHPARILPLNQPDLLHPRPSLQLFLPSDRILHKRMPLKPHQSIAVVLLRVPLEHPILVLPDSRLNITGHPNIKIMAPASHNVGVIHNLVHRASVNHPHNPNKSFPSLPHSNSTPMPPTPCHPELRGSQHFVSHEVEGPALATAVARPPSPRITGCPSIAVFAMGGM
jgi:hypothetical protein